MTPKSLGILVARTILSGDLTLARTLAGNKTSWTVPEARAICGACNVAQTRGWPVSWKQFFGG